MNHNDPLAQHGAMVTNIRNDIAGSPERVCVSCGQTWRRAPSHHQHICPDCKASYDPPCCEDPRPFQLGTRAAPDGTEFVRVRCTTCGHERETEI